MTNYQVPTGHTQLYTRLGGESGLALKKWGDITLDMPIWVNSALLDIARESVVAKLSERLAFRLRLFASDEYIEPCAPVCARVCV